MSVHPAESSDHHRAQASLPRILAITSGKGGVGKSSIAVNLGLTLARSGRRVCILDADTGLANVNLLLGLQPQKGLAEVLSGDCTIEEVLTEGPHGLKVIPGASGIREYVELSPSHQRRLVTELARIEPHFDDLILDTAAGIGDTTLDFVAAGHRVLLVITPEPTSLTDAFALLKVALRRHPLDCQVIVNMATDIREARAVYQRFSGALEKYLGLAAGFLGCIQRDESMRAAVTLQRPVALFPEHDPSVRPFQRLEQALNDLPWETSNRLSFSRFWFRQGLRPPPPEAAANPAPSRDAIQATEKPTQHHAKTTSPESGADRSMDFEALRRMFREYASQVGEPCALAEWIQILEADYRDQFGIPAVDPAGLIDWLIEHPKACEGVLDQIRERLEHPPHSTPLLIGSDTVALPDLDLDEFPTAANDRSLTTPIPTPEVVHPRAIHPLDVDGFGSQQDLLQWLRDSRNEGPLLIEQLQRRSRSV